MKILPCSGASWRENNADSSVPSLKVVYYRIPTFFSEQLLTSELKKKKNTHILIIYLYCLSLSNTLVPGYLQRTVFRTHHRCLRPFYKVAHSWHSVSMDFASIDSTCCECRTYANRGVTMHFLISTNLEIKIFFK